MCGPAVIAGGWSGLSQTGIVESLTRTIGSPTAPRSTRGAERRLLRYVHHHWRTVVQNRRPEMLAPRARVPRHNRGASRHRLHVLSAFTTLHFGIGQPHGLSGKATTVPSRICPKFGESGGFGIPTSDEMRVRPENFRPSDASVGRVFRLVRSRKTDGMNAARARTRVSSHHCSIARGGLEKRGRPSQSLSRLPPRHSARRSTSRRRSSGAGSSAAVRVPPSVPSTRCNSSRSTPGRQGLSRTALAPARRARSR